MAANEPALNVPRSVAWAAAALTAVQIVRDLLPDEIDLTLLLALAFIPARYSGAALELVNGDATFVLPAEALPAVMSRFGAPFDAEASIGVVATLELGAEQRLRHVRHLAGYDVIARDYLVYERPGQPTLCALSTPVTAALLHLGRAAAQLGRE